MSVTGSDRSLPRRLGMLDVLEPLVFTLAWMAPCAGVFRNDCRPLLLRLSFRWRRSPPFRSGRDQLAGA